MRACLFTSITKREAQQQQQQHCLNLHPKRSSKAPTQNMHSRRSAKLPTTRQQCFRKHCPQILTMLVSHHTSRQQQLTSYTVSLRSKFSSVPEKKNQTILNHFLRCTAINRQLKNTASLQHLIPASSVLISFRRSIQYISF